MDITVEDIKELTFQLFLAERQIARLRAMVAEAAPTLTHTHPHPGALAEPAGDVDEPG